MAPGEDEIATCTQEACRRSHNWGGERRRILHREDDVPAAGTQGAGPAGVRLVRRRQALDPHGRALHRVLELRPGNSTFSKGSLANDPV